MSVFLAIGDSGQSANASLLEFKRPVIRKIDAPDDEVETVIRAILDNGRTGEGHPGDGSVLVIDVASAYRIADGSSL